MKDNMRSVGAVIGFCGGQLAAILIFALFKEQCCTAGICLGEAKNCLFGKSFGGFWALYGNGLSIIAALAGAAITSAAGEQSS